MKRRPARAKFIAVHLEILKSISAFTQPPLKVVEVWLQIAVQRGYDESVVRVEG